MGPLAPQPLAGLPYCSEAGVVVTLVLWDQELEVRRLVKRIGLVAPIVRIFSNDARHREAPLAASVLRGQRSQIINAVSRWNGKHPLALDAAVDDMIHRTRALKLRAPISPSKARAEVTAVLTSKAVHGHYSATRRQWFAV